MGGKQESQNIMLETGTVSLMKSREKVDFFDMVVQPTLALGPRDTQRQPASPVSVPC
jgi:hypothetical protein